MIRSIQKRKREGITDYRKRYRTVKSGIPRLVVRCSGKGVTAQIVKYANPSDTVCATVNERSLRKAGMEVSGNSVPVCYAVGYLIGRKAREMGIENAILDTGRRHPSKGGRITAVLRGAVEAGLEIPHDPGILPDDDRIEGKHLKRKLDMRKMIEKMEAK